MQTSKFGKDERKTSKQNLSVNKNYVTLLRDWEGENGGPAETLLMEISKQ